MEIELATVEDLEQIRSLYEELFAYMAQLQPDYCKAGQISPRFVENTIKTDRGDVFVAREKGKVVGFALLLEQQTPTYDCVVPYKFGYLSDLVVAPASRGKNVGSALIQKAKEWAKGRKLSYLELNVIEENKGAKKLYAREGFTTSNLIMKCKLDD